uniref:Uncharacterized protein n=1 Tax=Opuntia streptacantha TaxID=393608 RepID=A0A7C8YML1_OPUST
MASLHLTMEVNFGGPLGAGLFAAGPLFSCFTTLSTLTGCAELELSIFTELPFSTVPLAARVSVLGSFCSLGDTSASTLSTLTFSPLEGVSTVTGMAFLLLSAFTGSALTELLLPELAFFFCVCVSLRTIFFHISINSVAKL